MSATDKVEDMGVERFTELLRAFHGICNDCVRSQRGVVAQYQGDGIICYFGFPAAQENDAQRAIAAALDIISKLSDAADHKDLSTRIGISSGTIMLPLDGDGFGANAVGSCINRAARLEALAEPNTALICEDTRRLVGSAFRLRDLSKHQLRGFKEEQHVFQVIKARKELTTRFETLRGHVATKLVGRQKERQMLGALFEDALDARGQSVVVSAGAGIGKSRLVSDLLLSRAFQQVRKFLIQCSAEHTGEALFPVGRYLEWLAGTQPTDGAERRHERLERLIRQVWGAGEEEANLILELISPMGADFRIDTSDSVQLRRSKALGMLADRLYHSAGQKGAFVVLFEDIHWMDPTSAQLLQALVERARDHNVLLIATTRDEPPFGEGLPGAELVKLAPFTDAECRELARQLVGAQAGDDEKVDLLIEKSEGVPLFLEEYSTAWQAVAQGGKRKGQIPLTLSGIVQEKLDRLQRDTRRFIESGAVIGRSFEPRLVAHVAEAAEAQINDMISELKVENLVHASDSEDGGDQLTFHHALIQDAIYQSISLARKKQLHLRAVDALVAREIALRPAEHVLAGHLERAAEYQMAAERYLAAGIASAGKGAASEALSNLESGLTCVTQMKSGRERDGLELRLLAVLGP
ncbi:MAG: AAA family ATPase, partial [Pseudomonadota bacterium]